MENTKSIQLGSEPSYFTGWQILWKTGLGFAVWILISFLMYIILLMTSSIIDPVLQNNGATAGQPLNPLIPLVFVIIAFVATFLGNLVIAGAYSFFYSTKYYDLGKTFSMILISNVVIFFIFIPLYLIFYNSTNSLYIVLWFHILFAIFTSTTHVEILTNPNYASAHLIGTTIGLSISAFLLLIAIKTLSSTTEKLPQYLLFLLPPIIGYVFMPLAHALWEKIYYKIYEGWNDFLYLPTPQEIHAQEEVMQEDVTDEDITVR